MKTRVLTAVAASLALIGGGVAASTGAAHADVVPPNAGTVILKVDKAAFISPTGNLSCVMDDAGVMCGALEHDWADLPVNCEEGEGGDFMLLTDTAAPSCMGDPLWLRAELNGPFTGYYARAGEARHDMRMPGQAHTFAGLNYYTTLENNRFRVQLEPTGVTATNLVTGRSFTMSRQQVTTA